MLARAGSENWIAYSSDGSGKVPPEPVRSTPNRCKQNRSSLLVQNVIDRHALAHGFPALRVALSGRVALLAVKSALGAELRRHVFKLHPFSGVEPDALVRGVAIESDCEAAWARRDAPQDSVISLFGDRHRLDSGRLLKQLRGDRHLFSLPGMLPQALQSLFQLCRAQT